MSDTLHTPSIRSLKHLHGGKVRDLYEIDESSLLIVTSDRLSAFDVILPTAIPGKGRILTAISDFWFRRTANLLPNHTIDRPLSDVLTDQVERDEVDGRAIVVKRLKALPVEAIVRGYIVGSGWKDYQRSGKVCGIGLPAGLQLADRLEEPLYTPSTKADVGEHDQNVDYNYTANLIGEELAAKVRDMSLRIYAEAREYAATRGIIIADTKFEFGVDENGTLHLIDEVLTPDSSRFWPVDQYRPGANPPSFDKQFVRDWLENQPWDKSPPGPELPADVAEQTAARYREALERLTG
jgi:phosphoribosylaminoimidazole-succinocarboxamide synthase